MLAFIPLFSLVILFIIFCKSNNSWRSSLLSAAITWGIIITVITEILSIFKILTFSWLLGIWVLTTTVLIFIYLKLFEKRKPLAHPKKASKIHDEATQLTPFLILLLCGVAFVISVVGLIALIAPPNNWDSMAYHLVRVVHWIQNHSVAHYPTVFLPQLYQGPWAEFTIMHLQVLSGGDRFANLVQLFSMVGSIIGVSLIAKHLGADLRGQVFSTVVAATIPMGILQSSNTQNDYVLSFWLVCFVYYVLLTVKERITLAYSLNIGASLGLAILTKGTAYIYAFPFFIWLLVSQFKQLSWKLWKPICTIAIIVLFINIGHYLRNFDLFGTPIATGPDQEKYTNEVFSIPTFISNIIRNLSLHLGTPISIVTAVIEKGVYLLHTALGVDINDPRTTSWGKFGVYNLSRWEASAGNLIHLLLIFSTITLCLTQKSLRRQRYLVSYILVVTSAFLLFCLLLKWQPWHSRLQLPIFVLFSASVGVVLSKLSNHKIANSTVFILLLSSFVWVFLNETRPLLLDIGVFKESSRIENIFNTSRTEQYFPYKEGNHNLKAPYIGAVNFVKSKGCSNVGLSLPYDPWEYPLWVFLQENNNQLVRIEHTNVENTSAVKYDIYPYNNFIPCAIISVDNESNKERQNEEIFNEKGTYIRKWSLAPVSVFIRQ
jgi:hypothetical protein